MPERLSRENNFDVIADVLETLRFRGSIFFSSDLAAPWGMSLAPEEIPRFHVALSGACYVGIDGASEIAVNTGEIVMLASGSAHWIADRPGRELVTSQVAGDACVLGNPLFQQGTITNRIMCGLVHFDRHSPHPIFSSLPEIVHLKTSERSQLAWATVSLIDSEITRTGRHSSPIIDRLTEVLFLQLLETYYSENQEVAGFIAALGDRRINHALSLIHELPGFDWTLISLGERVGMSRATLVRRFKDAVGVTPMTYIGNWRLTKAYNLIKYTTSSLENIAETVGYASANSLSKAFQRSYECTPSQLRRRFSKPTSAPHV